MLRFARALALPLALMLGVAPAVAADNWTAKDGNGNTFTFRSKDTGSGQAQFHVMADGSGNAYSSTNPLFVQMSAGVAHIGSVNLDQIGGVALVFGQATKAHSLPVAPPTDPDIFTTAVSLTAADAASTSATGQNGVSVISGTPTANSAMTVAINGQAEADFTVSGTFVGTIQFEGSANNGTTYTPRSAHVIGTKYRQTQVTGPGVFHVNSAGLTNVRARLIAFTSGSASVALNTTAGFGSAYVMNDLELVDNTTGLSPTMKQAGAATTSDNAMTVFDPQLDADVKGSAVASGLAGAAPANNANIGFLQGCATCTPMPISGTVTTVSGNALASPAYRLPASAAGLNATNFVAAAKKVFHIRFCNVSASFRSVKLYDKATPPTVGTDTPVATVPAPANFCAAIDWTNGFPFANGVSLGISGGAADSDTTAVSAGDIVGLNIDHN